MSHKTTIQCSKKMHKHKLSKWLKDEGVYSMLPKVLTCEDKYNAVKNSEIETETPEITGSRLEIDVNVPIRNKEKFNYIFFGHRSQKIVTQLVI